jgi:hypothetical protein
MAEHLCDFREGGADRWRSRHSIVMSPPDPASSPSLRRAQRIMPRLPKASRVRGAQSLQFFQFLLHDTCRKRHEDTLLLNVFLAFAAQDIP